MPTYEYECKSCSHSFEAFQAMVDDPLSTCPSCGGPVRRLIGGGMGIIFKGSGFYVNDSKKSSSSGSGSTPKTGAPVTSPSGSDSPSKSAEASPKSGEASPKSGEGGKASPKGESSASSSPSPKKEAV